MADSTTRDLTLGKILRGLIARVAVGTVLLAVLVISRIRGRSVRANRPRVGTEEGGVRVLTLGSFHNPNWPRAHILPIASCPNVREVIVVCDEAIFECEGVRTVCPPSWMVRSAGRSLARIMCFVITVARDRPDVLVGYHIMPNAVLCLAGARLFGGVAVYQMTGGPVQIIGGGYGSEGALIRRLGWRSRVLQSLMFHVVGQFDAVVVRGTQARQYLAARQLSQRAVVITGSVDTERFRPGGERADFDVVTVGRLVPCKRPELFVRIVAGLAKRRPSTQAAIVGDGPLLEPLRREAEELGVGERVHFFGKVDDVPGVLRMCRVFVLTSENEGMSIAMLEAMSAGLVPVVPDVGELAEVALAGGAGVLIDPSDTDATVGIIAAILDDSEGLSARARSARAVAESQVSVSAVAERWHQLLAQLS
ncbi:MAG: glycosyltransferase [Phycisphaerae bacterium]|nr:glycosyltransferase [Phycisphaerae bacterium]